MKKTISAARLKKLSDSGARVIRKSESKKPDNEKEAGDSDLVKIAVDIAALNAKTAEESQRLVADLGAKIAEAMSQEKRPSPCRLKVNRNSDGFIDSIDVIPIASKNATH